MTEIIARLILTLARGTLPTVRWALRKVEECNMAGPKETAARQALEDAVKAVEDWEAAEDETDAAALAPLTQRLNNLVPANPSHLPVGTDGNPVAPGDLGNQGPAAPAVGAPETSSDADDNSADESEQRNV
jgi:hypothetical protein